MAPIIPNQMNGIATCINLRSITWFRHDFRLAAAGYHEVDGKPHERDGSDRKHRIAEESHPSKRLHKTSLHEFRAACIPITFVYGLIGLEQADGQKAEHDLHQHADVDRPKRES